MTSSSPVGDRAAVLDLVLDDPHAGHRAVLALAEDLDGRAQEAQLDAALVAVRLALRVVAHAARRCACSSGRPRSRASSR